MFVTSIAYETIIIFLTVIKAYPIALQREIKTPLYTLLLEDGVAYYILIIASQIITTVSVFSKNPYFGHVVIVAYPPVAVAGIACGRLLLRPQRLLLNRSGTATGTEWRTDDLNTASITLDDISQGDKPDVFSLSQDLPGERLKTVRVEGSTNWDTRPRLSNKRPSLILMGGEGLVGVPQPSSPSYQESGSLDKEIDLSGHSLRGFMVEREDVRQVDGELISREVVQAGDFPPFSYGSRRNVLESNNGGGDGVLTISRLGRYD